jgi:hypothetical protein
MLQKTVSGSNILERLEHHLPFRMPLYRAGLTLIIMFLGLILFVDMSGARVTGPCANCHTMHNSQDGGAMNFDNSTQPNNLLLRTGNCVGCHAQGGPSNIIDLGGCETPQVYHTDGIDLAGGNFAYIDGTKGSGAFDGKGHNVIDLVQQDSVLAVPPGGPIQGGHTHPTTMVANLTCAGLYGCHGNAHFQDPMASMQGAHHGAGSSHPTGDTTANSFRFMLGVEGLEISDWQNTNATHHNEYKKDLHQATGPWVNACGWCHGPDNPWHGNSGDVLAPGSGINYLCLRCHPRFHSGTNTGGNINNPPWFKHPVNVAIPDKTEYSAFTTYNVDAPVARNDIPNAPSPVVTPGRTAQWGIGEDYVACISCHKAHGTDYPDILRWDYSTIIAAGGSNTNGCFICHTTKDDP